MPAVRRGYRWSVSGTDQNVAARALHEGESCGIDLNATLSIAIPLGALAAEMLLFPFEVHAEKTEDLREAVMKSELRQSVMVLSDRDWKLRQAAFELDELPPAAGVREALTAAEIKHVLLIPYQCDHGAGLTKVAVGLGELRQGAAHSIDWSEFGLLSLDVLRAGPQLLELPEDEPSFTSSALPELPLMGRPRPARWSRGESRPVMISSSSQVSPVLTEMQTRWDVPERVQRVAWCVRRRVAGRGRAQRTAGAPGVRGPRCAGRGAARG